MVSFTAPPNCYAHASLGAGPSCILPNSPSIPWEFKKQRYLIMVVCSGAQWPWDPFLLSLKGNPKKPEKKLKKGTPTHWLQQSVNSIHEIHDPLSPTEKPCHRFGQIAHRTCRSASCKQPHPQQLRLYDTWPQFRAWHGNCLEASRISEAFSIPRWTRKASQQVGKVGYALSWLCNAMHLLTIHSHGPNYVEMSVLLHMIAARSSFTPLRSSVTDM